MESKKLAKRPKKRGNPVKALLVAAGIKQVDISRQCRVSSATVSAVVSGKKTSARIRGVIADRLGVKVSDLWPDSRRAA